MRYLIKKVVDFSGQYGTPPSDGQFVKALTYTVAFPV